MQFISSSRLPILFHFPQAAEVKAAYPFEVFDQFDPDRSGDIDFNECARSAWITPLAVCLLAGLRYELLWRILILGGATVDRSGQMGCSKSKPSS